MMLSGLLAASLVSTTLPPRAPAAGGRKRDADAEPAAAARGGAQVLVCAKSPLGKDAGNVQHRTTALVVASRFVPHLVLPRSARQTSRLWD
ncbi:hypothetical protein [Candidatus Aalborgicola defluviihabitans]|uniref:hypothetical protein n=1 Tax=Candidatus Aalborgicola defluviihabitans TaxID=3386187 RepID=UPI0039B9897B